MDEKTALALIAALGKHTDAATTLATALKEFTEKGIPRLEAVAYRIDEASMRIGAASQRM